MEFLREVWEPLAFVPSTEIMEDAIVSLIVAVVSPIIKKFSGKAYSSYFGGDVTSKEIRKLQTIILPKIQTVIEATEPLPANKLKPWLIDLQAVAFEAEDVLDLYEYEAIKNKVMLGKYAISCYKPLQKLKAKSKEFFAFMLPKTKLKDSLEKLEQSAKEAESLLPLINTIRQAAPQRDAKSQQSTATVSGMSSPIFGRDEERDNLINMLINEPCGESTCCKMSIPVLAVLGIGGAGKTTLAQAVYNDEGVKRHFDKRMWVHVSRDFDVYRVTREIIESTGQGRHRCSNISNLDTLQRMLEGILNSKKFLLVLDDIWCEDKGEWDKLLIPLNKVGDIESRILITTRMEGVALTLGVGKKNLVPLNELKAEDCWSILKYYAFGDNASKIKEYRALAGVGEKIASKLKKSPLAARLVGCLLRRKVDVDAWEKVLKQDMLSGTLNCLLLSFQYLTPQLQRCFAFCSLFPKGFIFHQIIIDDLALIWIALGFVEAPEDNELTIVEKGGQCFTELLSYSFFQRRPDSIDGYYIIHDLIHDLAEKVSKGHCFRIEANGPVDIPATTVHLSIMEKLPVPFPDVSELVNLRTIMCLDSHINNSLLDVSTKLRVLYSTFMPKLTSSIGQLKHLRYLGGYGSVEQLPDSFGRLYHLQFLDLHGQRIERVPKSFSNLVNLQCLLTGNSEEYSKIPEIGKLTSLQTLRFYHVETSREFGIGQLKNLHRLRGSLTIEGLENVKDKTEAIEARLNQKKHLEELILKWGSQANRHGRADEEVLEGIEPHSNLRELEIRGYQGAKAPSWMQHILPSLRSLKLFDCPNLTGVPHLPHSLKGLNVSYCPELKQLSPFPYSLERLTMENSSGFEDLLSIFISFHDDDEEEQWRLHRQNYGRPQLFPLEHLIIEDCSVLGGKMFNLSLQKFDLLGESVLRGLPRIQSLLLGPNLRRLWRLEIKNCENLQSLEGIGTLPDLNHLEISDLPELTWMGNLQALTSIRNLWVFKCPKLTTGPGAGGERDIANRLPSLKEKLYIDEPLLLAVLLEEQGLNSLEALTIRKCSQDRLFSTEQEHLFLQLTSSEELEFRDCENLPSLPANLEKLSSLKKLTIQGCPKMELLPNMPTSLVSLDIDDCENLLSLPGNLEKLSSLKELTIRECPKMEPTPNMPISLVSLDIDDCENLLSLPGNLELSSLEELTIRGCPKMEPLPNMPTSLVLLYIDDCENLLSLPGNLEKLSSLKELTIRGCPKMEPLPNMLTSLVSLFIDDCENLLSLSRNLEKLSSLEELYIRKCPKMESLPNMPASLVSLNIYDCENLLYLPGNLEKLFSLKELYIEKCPKMESLPNMPTSLVSLNIDDCENLLSLPGNLESLSSLKELYIEKCPKVKSLPNLPTSLDIVHISNCNSQLKKKYGVGGPLHHMINHIPATIIE